MFLDLLASSSWWYPHWHWLDLDWAEDALKVVARVGIAFFVYRDARQRSPLLFDMPPWLWAVIALAFGLWGGVAYWVANCSGWVTRQSRSAPGEPAPQPRRDG